MGGLPGSAWACGACQRACPAARRQQAPRRTGARPICLTLTLPGCTKHVYLMSGLTELVQCIWPGCILLGFITWQPVLCMLLRVLLIGSDYIGFLSSMCTHQPDWQTALDRMGG